MSDHLDTNDDPFDGMTLEEIEALPDDDPAPPEVQAEIEAELDREREAVLKEVIKHVGGGDKLDDAVARAESIADGMHKASWGKTPMDNANSLLVHKREDHYGGDRDTTYRGYLIKRGPFDNMFRVTKGGFHICTCVTLDDAKHSIDEIVG